MTSKRIGNSQTSKRLSQKVYCSRIKMRTTEQDENKYHNKKDLLRENTRCLPPCRILSVACPAGEMGWDRLVPCPVMAVCVWGGGGGHGWGVPCPCPGQMIGWGRWDRILSWSLLREMGQGTVGGWHPVLVLAGGWTWVGVVSCPGPGWRRWGRDRVGGVPCPGPD